MEIRIREMKPDELPLILMWRMEVLENVFGFTKEDSAYEKLLSENERYYREMLGRGGHIGCFAEGDGEIIGCGGVCLYDEMPSPDNLGGKCAYLMNIYTRQAFRGHGIATKVISYLIDRAKAEGADKIYLESSKQALPLYHEMGFTEMEDYLKLKS